MNTIDEAIRYLAGADDAAAAFEFEEQLFRDGELALAAAWLLELRAALKELARAGPVVPVVTPTELASLAARHTLIECGPEANVIDVAVSREVAFVAARLPVRLEHARSVDVEFCKPNGVPYFRVHEAPYDAAHGQVILLCERHVALSATPLRVLVRDEHGSVRGDFSLVAREA